MMLGVCQIQNLCCVEEEKSFYLCHDSKKLAIACTVISTLSTLYDIMNDLQVCADCHTVIKIIANIMGEQL